MCCVFFILTRPFYDAVGRRRHRDFDLSLDNVWYGSVTLIFKISVWTDSNELQNYEYAIIEVFFNYAQGR